MMVSQKFLNWKQAQKTVKNCSKKIRKEEKGKAKKGKTEKPEDVDHFLGILISAHARAKMSSISFPEPTCLVVSTKTRSSGIHSGQTTGHSREHARV